LEPVAKRTSPAENGSGGVALEDRLLATKLYAPSTRTNIVTRSRLTEPLDEGVMGKLTLVCAPAGFGKTTLLSEWVLRSEFPVGWLSLDERDNDPTRFLSYMIAAIQTATPDIGEDALSLLRSPQPPPAQVVLTLLVNELATVAHDLVLILDDYHVIDDEAIHAAVAFLLEHLPPQMHLIIASRTDPPLPLSRLLASGQLTKLTASDLRFTSEEATAFLREVMGIELSTEEVTALEEKTEGWIAGLQLAALSLQGRENRSGFISAFAGTNRQVFDYLAEEVLNRQPEDATAFLLETSILDRLSGSLCDAVTGREGGQARLEELEGANLLMVPLDDKRRWYRYHHLFSDFLRERLRRSHPEIVSELHLRASVWYERNGTASEAVGHALAAEDFNRAGYLAERLVGEITGRGERPAIQVFLRALPREVVRSRPQLLILYAAYVPDPSGRLDASEALLREAEQMLGLGETHTAEGLSADLTVTSDNEELTNYAGEITAVRAFIAGIRGETERAVTLGRRGLELLSEDNFSHRTVAAINLATAYLDSGDLVTARRAIGEALNISHAAGYPTRIANCLVLQGRLQALQGNLSDAAETYERLLRLAAEHGEALSMEEGGEAHVGMGELLLERNNLEAAMRHLQEGVELLLKWSGIGVAANRLLEGTDAYGRAGRPEEISIDFAAVSGVVTGYVALARARHAQGDAEGAFEALLKADRIAHNPHIGSRWKVRVEAWQARLHIHQGDLKAAGGWAQERGLGAENEFEYSPESELEQTTLARLLIARGRHGEALRVLERLLEAAEASGRGRTVIEVFVLKALVLQAQDDEPGALAALRSALTLAEPEGFVRVVVDEGAPMLDLLRRVVKARRRGLPDLEGDVPLEYVGKLLEALGAPVAASSRVRVRDPGALVLDPITERELEVLKLLDTDLSNREIAARLFVSVATVKTHTKHLYRKLGVRARHEAIVRGKELGVL
jgi:LuxR family transcriptional regulator, maltose regulon positive regulatory protein